MVRINIENLPLTFRFLGLVMLVYGGLDLYIAQKYLLDIILLVVGLILVFTHQRLDINLKKKVYQSYYWILGLKMQNETVPFDGVSSVICSQGSYSAAYGKVQRIHIKGIMYKGYIQLTDDDEPLFAGQNRNKNSLLRKMTKISDQLQVPLEDLTS